MNMRIFSCTARTLVGCREIPSRKFNMSDKVSCKVISFDVLIHFILKFVIVF